MPGAVHGSAGTEITNYTLTLNPDGTAAMEEGSYTTGYFPSHNMSTDIGAWSTTDLGLRTIGRSFIWAGGNLIDKVGYCHE